MATQLEPRERAFVHPDIGQGAIAAAVRDAWQQVAPPPAASEFCEAAVVRILTDLGVESGQQVLVVEPATAVLPVALAALGATVAVQVADEARARRLRGALRGVPAGAVWVTSESAGDVGAQGGFDRILVAGGRVSALAPELASRLAPDGAAIWPTDRAEPPRHLCRLLRSGRGAAAREELDLVRFAPLLGDLLVDGGFALRQEVCDALARAAERGSLLGEELLALGAVREEDLFRTLARQRGLPFRRTSDVLPQLDVELVRQLPRKFLDHYRFVPVAQDGAALRVVTCDPELPTWELHGVFEVSTIEAELISPTDLRRIWTAIDLGFVQAADNRTEARRGAAVTEATAEVQELAPAAAGDSRASGMFDAILLDAIAERASDIHIERYQDGGRLRFRVDGSLRDVDRYRLGGDELTALVNVVKLAADMDIAERRMPQGGRVRRSFEGQAYDLRVQTQPTLYQESVVIRVLAQDRRPPTIEELGFHRVAAERYRRLLRDPQGLILVVGATGTGKTTTLYAGLQMLANDTTRKVLTIEDPIEFAIHGIQQAQVNAAVGFRFAEAVRSFLRQDPDVVLIGEVRDPETALEAIRAAQTGHLVLATMHCNDSVDAVQRLADLGMGPTAIASELTAVVAQRLARRICGECRAPALPDPELVQELFPDGVPDDFVCFEGRGCERCRGTGTYGRVAVVEFLQVGPTMRRAIASGVVVDDLRAIAAEGDLQTLRESAIDLVRAGVIPAGELYEVLSAEQMRPLQPHG